MMEGKCLLVVLLAAMAVCTSASPRKPRHAQHWTALKAVAHSNLDFSRALFKVMSKKTEGNFLFSPTSIHAILAMAASGARGVTAQEMVRGLHLTANQKKFKNGFRLLTTSLNWNHTVTTKMANKIFTDSRFCLAYEFVHTAINDFHSGSEVVDFHLQHEEARVHINSWVMDNTENKIENLITKNSVNNDTLMVLVNALYFKGLWIKKFKMESTSQQPFHISPGVTKEVPMMKMLVRSLYTDSETLNAQILEIPYVGNKISMIIILPKKKHGLRGVETRLARMSFSNLTSRYTPRHNVRLYLPKFKLEHSTDLKETLIKIGMEKMFSDDADFSGLVTKREPIMVSKVLHKAFIEVDENGTNSATAKDIFKCGDSSASRSGPVITFKADHPFIFALLNLVLEYGGTRESTNTILFMGRYAGPN